MSNGEEHTEQEPEAEPALVAPDEVEPGQNGQSQAGHERAALEHAEMVRELQQLRRGHGLHASDVLARVGERLIRVCGLDSSRPPGERRQRLVHQIALLVTGLPEDLRLAVQAAFALPPADESRFLRARMEWLAQRLERDPRTAMRRVESGLSLLAERMLSEPGQPSGAADAYAPDGWYVEEFKATLMMHVDPVQVLETRRVCCTRESLNEIAVAWSIPTDGPDPSAAIRVDLLYGGEMIKDEDTSTATFWSARVRLPRALHQGEQHEFQVRVSTLSPGDMRPYYVLSPFRRCDEFVVRAKFDRLNGPEEIWRVDGVPFQLLDQNQPIGEVLHPDTVGEVASEFHNLRQGLSYGLRWRFGPPS